ncbi:hypothetical protein Tco_1062350, partial [Tanacetum coccineum]
VKELPEYDESQFKIKVFTPQEPVVTIDGFFHRAVKKMVATGEYPRIKPIALCMQGFIDSIKRIGRHIPPGRNATRKWML